MRKPFTEMSTDELRAWMAEMRDALLEKKGREREWLDERAGLQVHDLRDILMEQDQILLSEVLLFFEQIESQFGFTKKEPIYPVRTEG